MLEAPAVGAPPLALCASALSGAPGSARAVLLLLGPLKDQVTLTLRLFFWGVE